MNTIINLENMTEGQLDNLIEALIEQRNLLMKKLEQRQAESKTSNDDDNIIKILNKNNNSEIYYDSTHNLVKITITDNEIFDYAKSQILEHSNNKNVELALDDSTIINLNILKVIDN